MNEFIIDKKPEEYLFTSQRGSRPITRIQAYHIINHACQTAGINAHVGTHTLSRIPFLSRKKDVALLQCIFNHSAPSVTLRYIGINQDIIDSNLRSFVL